VVVLTNEGSVRAVDPSVTSLVATQVKRKHQWICESKVPVEMNKMTGNLPGCIKS